MSSFGVLRWLAPGVALVIALTSLAGCGADGEGGSGAYRINGCSACHGGDREGTALGPALNWEAGAEVALADGSTVPVDAGYVERSIGDPAAQITAGWDDTMPTVDLSESDVDALVAFLLGSDDP